MLCILNYRAFHRLLGNFLAFFHLSSNFFSSEQRFAISRQKIVRVLFEDDTNVPSMFQTLPKINEICRHWPKISEEDQRMFQLSGHSALKTCQQT